jgi:polysaccharide export outer membrane protein
MGRLSRLASVVTIGAAALAACSHGNDSRLRPYALALEKKPVYRLAVGDKLRIDVPGEKQLSGEYEISPKGTIAMALVGEVPAVGLTTRELEGALAERFGQGFLLRPEVTVQPVDVRPYFVFGEVAHPGQFAAKSGLTLADAIAGAGGYTDRANRQAVFIRRAATNRDYRVDPKAGTIVAPGDVILVGPRHP